MTNPAQWHTNYAHEALEAANNYTNQIPTTPLQDHHHIINLANHQYLKAATQALIAIAETLTQNQQQPHHTTNHTTTHTENR